MADFLLDSFLCSSQIDSLKSSTGENYIMDHNYVTEDGVYTSGIGVNPMYNYVSAPENSVSNPQTPSTQLPQYLEAMVTSLLQDSDGFPLSDNPHFEISQFDIDIAAINLEDNDSPLDGDIFGPSASTPSYQTLASVPGQISPSLADNSTGSARPQRKSQRRVKTPQASSHLQLDDASTSSSYSPGYEPQYPDLSELGVPSPAMSSSSGYSDSCGEETQKKGRQRRPRVSYSTLTEEEKYKRIRDLNNEASRHYRERQKNLLTTWEQQLPGLTEENEKLKKKYESLKAYRDKIERFTHQLLQEYSLNNATQDFQQ
ncbi:probable basic-leucine zipper transcription factor Q [Palaemon carinicauda]|uniref:probable basic-leucine zipper transcription factor Q n=1 Tax=Palaemon carinicauda TaxID=392227 RepID=UPI0035B60E6A